MKSFRTELENPLVEKDIIELEKKIFEFETGSIPEPKFRSLRLARGIYGQRQQGVQMIRIKLPYGRLTTKQLNRIADISDEYSTGILHLTTRQDIQIHFVSLDKTPELWAKLEQDNITIREACGNTVRNVTASENAGIDPNEPFDITPYAHATFLYFLRKPFGQELGRKIKIAFSNSEEDTAVTYIHDIGFIPKVKIEEGIEKRGFKVLIGGGLGAQPFLAQPAFEFLPENKFIPFIEATLRVFDRHGERASRHKARIKYLINKIGLDEFLKLLHEEEKAITQKEYVVNRELPLTLVPKHPQIVTTFKPANEIEYKRWLATNTFKQKQEGFYGVDIKVQLGNLTTDTARELSRIVNLYAADDIRVTINQGFLLRYVREAALLPLYIELKKLGLANPGFNSVADITACPGTDTCNLGISNSTQIAKELEKVIYEEYPNLIYNRDIKIKISGCMNSCGQHGLAQIGFHGSSFKVGQNVVPALQLLLGGGTLGNGKGRIADKVLKVASKRGPQVLRTLLNDYQGNAVENENFNTYYDRKGEDYFYQLLKPIADNSNLQESEYLDWGKNEKFQTAIGVGECAGVVIDLVATLIIEAEEKLAAGAEAFDEGKWSDSIYFSYAAILSVAKSLLLDKQVHVNTQHGIINDFDKHFVETGDISFGSTFKELALEINQHEPSKEFAEEYFAKVTAFFKVAKAYRPQKETVLQ
jgi:sulfite reductase (ferredoxin)